MSRAPSSPDVGLVRTWRRRRRVTPIALAVGLLGSAVTSAGVATTYGAITATVVNTGNSVGTGTLALQETDSSGTATTACTSSDGGSGNSTTCTRFDKLGGGTLAPGDSSPAVVIRLYDIGTLPASAFTASPGSCTVTSNPMGGTGSACDALTLSATCTRYSRGAQMNSSTLASNVALSAIANRSLDLKAQSCAPDPTTAGSSTYVEFRFTVSLSAAAGTEVQGQTVKQPIIWQLTAGS